MHVLTLFCRESQVKFAEEKWKQRQLVTYFGLACPDFNGLGSSLGLVVFLSFYTHRYQKIRESQVKIAEEQCKSELSAMPTCNMPWPRLVDSPDLGPIGPVFFIVSCAPPLVPCTRSNTIHRAYTQLNYVQLRSTNKQRISSWGFTASIKSLAIFTYVATCGLKPGPRPED